MFYSLESHCTPILYSVLPVYHLWSCSFPLLICLRVSSAAVRPRFDPMLIVSHHHRVLLQPPFGAPQLPATACKIGGGVTEYSNIFQPVAWLPVGFQAPTWSNHIKPIHSWSGGWNNTSCRDLSDLWWSKPTPQRQTVGKQACWRQVENLNLAFLDTWNHLNLDFLKIFCQSAPIPPQPVTFRSRTAHCSWKLNLVGQVRLSLPSREVCWSMVE